MLQEIKQASVSAVHAAACSESALANQTFGPLIWQMRRVQADLSQADEMCSSEMRRCNQQARQTPGFDWIDLQMPRKYTVRLNISSDMHEARKSLAVVAPREALEGLRELSESFLA